jgi:probable rRNA maturation factor
MDIQIANRQKRHPIALRKIHHRTRIILDGLKRPEAELSILFVDDARIGVMNQQFLGRRGPTNVIAFPMRDGRFSDLTPDLLGDVVISVDTAQREARAAGLSLEQRLTQLLVHGILHLCGYDHERDPVGARRMAAKSRSLMKRIEAGSKLKA